MEALDESVTRLLSVMYRHDLFSTTQCSSPCEELLMKNVTSEAHADLARTIAAKSIVLLKNEGDVLPLTPQTVKTIAVTGTAAFEGPIRTPGIGQDTKFLTGLILVVSGLLLKCLCSIWINSPRPGYKYAALCLSLVVFCGGVMLISKLGGTAISQMLKGDYYSGGGSGHVTPSRVVRPIDGIRSRASAAGIVVIEANTDHISEAEDAVGDADVTIVVGATTSREGVDRASLNLDHVDEFIANVSKAAKRTVVLSQTPGAVLTPWRESVHAIALMFLGGQATGAAWADVLFGDTSPMGKLPISLPDTHWDQTLPGDLEKVKYWERLHTGYRSGYHQYAFSFGHGLSYTNFSYSEATSLKCTPQSCFLGCAGAAYCVSLTVTNVGRREGATVPQLYLQFPYDAGQPSPILKGFFNTGLLPPSGSTTAIFPLHTRDISYYDEDARSWVVAAGATAHIRESYADHRTSIDLEFS